MREIIDLTRAHEPPLLLLHGRSPHSWYNVARQHANNVRIKALPCMTTTSRPLWVKDILTLRVSKGMGHPSGPPYGLLKTMGSCMSTGIVPEYLFFEELELTIKRR